MNIRPNTPTSSNKREMRARPLTRPSHSNNQSQEKSTRHKANNRPRRRRRAQIMNTVPSLRRRLRSDLSLNMSGGLVKSLGEKGRTAVVARLVAVRADRVGGFACDFAGDVAVHDCG